MRTLTLLAIALLLSGCASLGLTPVGQPTLAGLEKYVPLTAAVLGPACQVAAPTGDDTNACDLYKINMAVCNANITGAEQLFETGLTLVNPALGTAVTVGADVVNATEAWWCKNNGYYVTVAKVAKP
jgi:hypothetical protein